MSSASGRFVIAFNGEIYNHRELRRLVGAGPEEFRGHSDTEVLLSAIERWGCAQTLPMLQGMFAFVLWDRESGHLWLCRDRMGIKPLYLFQSADGLAFASELRALLACSFVPRRGSLSAAWRFLQQLHVSGDDSILSDVIRVPPGSFLKFRIDRGPPTLIDSARYWDVLTARANGARNPILSAQEGVERLHDALGTSVATRSFADVPVGAFLSGGIDSSLIVALMAQHQSVKTFTIGFDNPAYNEAEAAKTVASHIGTIHTHVDFTTGDASALVPHLAQISDEPMANPSLLPTLLISEVARRDVTVALSGDGGDELFGGYNRYLHAPALLARLAPLPHEARRLLASWLRRLQSLQNAGSLWDSVTPASFGSQHSSAERLAKLIGIIDARGLEQAYQSLLRVGMRSPFLLGQHPPPPTLHPFSREHLLDDMMAADQAAYLPHDLLAKVDRASMWHSLEARVPFLDHNVVEISWRIPNHHKIVNGIGKWPLRQVLRRYVPDHLMDRPKMGFSVPIADWMAGELREWAGDTLHSESTFLPWDRAALSQSWTLFEQGRQDLAMSLWAAAVLQSWSDHWRVSF